MADAVKMDVLDTVVSSRIYLKDVTNEKLATLEPFDGILIDKDNLDENGAKERQKMQTLFSQKVDQSYGSNTASDIEQRGFSILGLKEYEEIKS